MEVIRFWYTNHKGEKAFRTVRPTKLYYGESEWHHGKQWLLNGICHDRNELRTFAIKDIGGLGPVLLQTLAQTVEYEKFVGATDRIIRDAQEIARLRNFLIELLNRAKYTEDAGDFVLDTIDRVGCFLDSLGV